MALTNSAKRYVRDKIYLGKRKVRKIVLAAPFWVLTIGIAMTSLGIGRYVFLTENRKDQKMNYYWEYEATTPFRHMSVYARGARPGGPETPAVYINNTSSLRRSDILAIRTALQNVTDSSLGLSSKGGLPQDGRPRGWEDCYSSYLTANITSIPDPMSRNEFSFDSASEIIAIDGNFPAFHPFRYMSGGFLPEIAVDNRQIVLNDVLAWKFYKSYDVVGEKVRLWGQEFTIIGVVAEPSDGIARSAGTEQPRAYIYFSAMEELAPLTAPSTDTQTDANGNVITPAPSAAQASAPAAPASGAASSDNARPDMAILCYEAMLPEAVKNVAKNDMSSALTNYTPADPNFYLLSNTGRYNVINTWNFMWPIGKTQERLSVYEFPYWEKTAQLTSQHLFADEIVAVAGFVTLVSGTIMAALRYRKMSRK